jgi:antitoxin component YwqK of YwqJK toxin-antitoxin module
LFSNTKHKMTIANGEQQEFAPNGQKILNCHYQNGKLSGPYHQYDDQGKLLRTGYYRNDQMVGPWSVSLDETWQTEATKGCGRFKNGQPVGLWTFYVNNKLHSIINYTSQGPITTYSSANL